MYRKKIKDYEYIKENSDNDLDENNILSNKCSKIIIFFVVIFVLNFIIILYFKMSKSDNLSEIKLKEDINYFNEIFPKINNIDTSVDIFNIKEMFKSRKIYINEKNITNEYIHFLRPINPKEEEQYNQILYKNVLYDEYPNTKKQGQMNVNDFFNSVNKDKLIQSQKIEESNEPKISIVIPLTTQKPNLIRSFNSIQSQTFKDLEIIIVDDNTENNGELLQYLFENEPRLRIVTHSKKMGLWRTRMDGFLYSKGKYILHFDPGDILSDNFVLEDAFNFVTKYNLDTIRFSFSRLNMEKFSLDQLEDMLIYPTRHLKIIYGRPDYDVHEYGYGTIWNRLVRANIITKGFDLIGIDLLNAYKDIWEDIWWNDLIDRVSFSNLIVNKLGYINFYDRNAITNDSIKDNAGKDKTIREFIYSWYFDYELLPRDANKTIIMDKLRLYSQQNNTYNDLPINLDFLNTYFGAYRHFLYILFKDPFIPDEEKKLIKILYNKVPKNKNKY
jgi:glycosyltransferase involved in cell wall biosynthesis